MSKIRKFPEYKLPIKLNIGCGNDNRKDYINIDNRDLGYNMVWDIRDGIPFPDNSVQTIFCSHLIEHLDNEESLDFLRECLRVVQKGSSVVIRAPLFNTIGAIFPGHKTFWSYEKVLVLTRLEEPLPKFKITENEILGEQLLFTLKKL